MTMAAPEPMFPDFTEAFQEKHDPQYRRPRTATMLIPMMPPRECSPNWHGPWRARAAAVKAFREAAGWATVAALGGDPFLVAGSSGFVAMDVDIAWCCGRRRLDDDNAWASLKAARDGISDVLFGSEDRWIIQGKLTQTRGDGTVTVTLRTANDV